MAALNAKNERDLLEEIDKLKSTTIELQAVVIELLRRENTVNRSPIDPEKKSGEKNMQIPLADRTVGKTEYVTKLDRHSTVNDDQLVTVDFHGHPLVTINQDGEIFVALRPIVEGIGLQWHAQRKRIRRDDVLSSVASMMDSVAEDGKEREMLCLPLKFINGWLFGIDTARIKKSNVRERILQYKRECYDVLYRYWHQGKAVNAREPVPATERPKPAPTPFQDCGIHDAEFLAFLAVTKGRMGGSRKMNELLSIHTAKVLRWIWYRCLDEHLWYTASRLQIAQDLGMHHTTALRCAKRLEEWRFIEQRIIARITECKLLRSVVSKIISPACSRSISG